MATKDELIQQAKALRAELDKLNEKAGGLRWDDGIQCKYHLLYDGTTDKIITGEKYHTHYADMRTIHCVDKEFVTTARTMIGDDALLTYLGRK